MAPDEPDQTTLTVEPSLGADASPAVEVTPVEAPAEPVAELPPAEGEQQAPA